MVAVSAIARPQSIACWHGPLSENVASGTRDQGSRNRWDEGDYMIAYGAAANFARLKGSMRNG